MYELVRADIRRLMRREAKLIEKIGVLLFNLGLHAVLLYRLSRWLHLHHMRLLAILVSYCNSVLTGAQISPRAMIGKGLAIYHPQGTVIGATAVIGSYCTLAHGNLIGQLYGDDDRPVIGDHFYAGPGAKILGKIEIGNNVHVGPNAIVVNSLPEGVTVAATPARIIYRAGSERRTVDHKAASRGEILSRLLLLLADTLGVATAMGPLDEATELLGTGIGLDSVEVLRLIGAIEEEFDLTIDDDELKGSHFKTVGSLVTFIQERLLP